MNDSDRVEAIMRETSTHLERSHRATALLMLDAMGARARSLLNPERWEIVGVRTWLPSNREPFIRDAKLALRSIDRARGVVTDKDANAAAFLTIVIDLIRIGELVVHAEGVFTKRFEETAALVRGGTTTTKRNAETVRAELRGIYDGLPAEERGNQKQGAANAAKTYNERHPNDPPIKGYSILFPRARAK